ncbi:TIM barrel protein [Pedobacter aquae]|uniref:TIM barrel protein n=1 Tax=Pedobacter aquae TaxID=2605747 RepID=A0A5C0VM28_9SPHI|nr:TIM barrel protein [Pedobacter aquae]QEK52270.1 TIM barrel protein [Pedobacter aquae]
MPKKTNRRSVIKNILAGTAALTTTPMLSFGNSSDEKQSITLKGNINHAVCKWTYGFLSLEELCILSKKIGIKAIDLVGPKEWDILKKHGIDSSMCNGAEINLVDGFAEPNFHEKLIQNYTEMIPMVAKAGYKNLICFSGNRRGMDDETGLNNAAKGLKELMALAEKHKVTLVMELLNSKINHKDYFADKTAWGVELCKRVGSENFKLLYDIYHMQVDEGDVIHTIKDSHPYIAHYHTAGVPGRNEIDENQELNYPAIMKAIVATGFKGYVAQEFIPKKEDKIASLYQAVKICDV